MRSQIARAAGFLAVTSIPFSFEHLGRGAAVDALVPALLTALAFAGLFLLGGYIGMVVVGSAEARSDLAELRSGSFAAVVLWTALFWVWSSLGPLVGAEHVPWILISHLLVVLGCGFTVSMLRSAPIRRGRLEV